MKWRSQNRGVIFGCCLLVIVFALAWIVGIWLLIGLLLDWANAHFGLGLNGLVLFAAHLILFLVINAIVGRGTQVARSK